MYELEAEDVDEDEDEDEDGHDSLSTRLRPRSMRKLLKLRARIWELHSNITVRGRRRLSFFSEDRTAA